MPVKLVGYFDGASKGNPGPSSFGICIYRNNSVILQESGHIGEATNNIAEYTAAIVLLERLHKLAQQLKPSAIEVRGDSLLVINQLSKKWKVKDKKLKKLYNNAKKIIDEIETITSISFQWVDRKENKKADKLAHSAR